MGRVWIPFQNILLTDKYAILIGPYTEAPMADVELTRQKAMDRERQKAHDQKMRGETISLSTFSARVGY